MSDSPSVSVIIPAYYATPELEEMTRDCVGSLKTFSSPDEIIVQVDHNGSGYAPTVNKGLEKAKGEVLIVSNNDIIFTPGWLEAILLPLDQGYDISSICTSDASWETRDEITEGDKFGSLWAIKRRVYDAIGGLSEEFGKGYAEDLDYRRRALQAGFKIGKNHAHLVEHIGKATFKSVDPDDISFHQAIEKYYQKWKNLSREDLLDDFGGDPKFEAKIRARH